MSQIASVTYLAETDIPFLGFWSKPKKYFFRKPVCEFSKFLSENKIREELLEKVDGINLAVICHLVEQEFNDDPVILTLRKNTGESNWLVKHIECKKLIRVLREVDLSKNSILKMNKEYQVNLVKNEVLVARKFLEEKLMETSIGEAVLVSIG